MFKNLVWDVSAKNLVEATLGEATTVATYTETHGGFYAWTMDYTIAVQHLHAVYFDPTTGGFVDTIVTRGTEECPSITKEQHALVTIDAPAELLAEYAAYRENLAYEYARNNACNNGCIVTRGALAIVLNGRNVAPGNLGRAAWLSRDSDRIGLDPRPVGVTGAAQWSWVSGRNACAVPADLRAALRPDELHGTPDWARGFVWAIPGGTQPNMAFRFMLELAEAPEKLEALRLLGEALRTRPAPQNDRKAAAAQTQLVRGVAEKLGFRKPLAKKPAAEKTPRARKKAASADSMVAA